MTNIFKIIENDQNLLLVGDINAHHPMWENDCVNIDRLGHDFADIITNSNLSLLNTGTHTRQNLFKHTTSTPDISLCSHNIFMLTEWTCNQENIGSDHFPIDIKIKSLTDNPQKIKVINWKMVEEELNKMNLDEIKDIENYEDKITIIINKNTKEIYETKTKKAKNWWTEK